MTAAAQKNYERPWGTFAAFFGIPSCNSITNTNSNSNSNDDDDDDDDGDGDDDDDNDNDNDNDSDGSNSSGCVRVRAQTHTPPARRSPSPTPTPTLTTRRPLSSLSYSGPRGCVQVRARVHVRAFECVRGDCKGGRGGSVGWAVPPSENLRKSPLPARQNAPSPTQSCARSQRNSWIH